MQLYQVHKKGQPISEPLPYDKAIAEKQRIVSLEMVSFLKDTDGNGDTQKFADENNWEVLPC